MKRQILSALGVALLPTMAMAANFAGSWSRDAAKSENVPSTQYWLTRDTGGGGAGGGGRGGNNGGGRGGAPEVIMKVEQTGNVFQVTDPQGNVRKYTLDGKAVTKDTDTGIQKSTTIAKTEGEAVVITMSRPYGGMPGNVTLEAKEVWSLSPDGKVLTVTTTHSSPAVQKIYKQTYNKK